MPVGISGKLIGLTINSTAFRVLELEPSQRGDEIDITSGETNPAGAPVAASEWLAGGITDHLINATILWNGETPMTSIYATGQFSATARFTTGKTLAGTLQIFEWAFMGRVRDACKYRLRGCFSGPVTGTGV